MKQLLRSSLLGLVALAAGLPAYAASRAYGVQIYSQTESQAAPKLISFPIDDPSTVTVEEDLSEYDILAATANNGIYYFLHGGEGEITPTKLVAYDMAYHSFKVIAEYNSNSMAAAIIPSDMTYDTDNDIIYVMGFDMTTASVIDGAASADMGLFTIDPNSGDCELIGNQGMLFINTIAYANGDLWGTDAEGNLWYMSKYSGYPEDIMMSTGITPYGTQSMTFAPEEQTFYWASYSEGESGAGESDLITFKLSEEWEIDYSELGAIGSNVELIGLYIDENSADSGAPRGVTELSVTPAAGGKEEVTVSWVNPLLSVGGAELNGNLSITLFREDEKVAELSGQPGETMSYSDKVPGAALYSYHVVATLNGLASSPVYATPVYVGKDAPGAPLNVKAVRAATGYDITVNWAAPDKGAQMGWFDPSEVTYTVTRFPDNKVIAENLTLLSFTDNTITDQQGYSYGIKAVAAGAEGPENISNIIVTGQPFNPPYKMTLSENDARLWTVANNDLDEYEWYVNRVMWGGTSDPFFRYYPENTVNPDGEANDWIISPFFNLESGKKYVVSYQVRLMGDLFPASSSLWIGQGTEEKDMTHKLISFEMERQDMDWLTRTVPVTVDKDGAYNFGYKAENRSPIQFYNFELIEVADYDLEALTVSGPSMLAVGETGVYEVEVKNNGFNEVKDYTVALINADGTTLAETKGATAINAGDILKVAVEWTPDAATDVNLSAKVIVDGDENTDNDTSDAIKVLVLADAKWIEINDGDTGIGFIPMYTNSAYSASQSIYTADQLNAESGTQIKAIYYYIDAFMGTFDVDCNVEVWLGNTDRSDFLGGEPVAEEDMTKVYSGHLNLTRGDEGFIFVFDTPFEYTGENIVVYVNHETDGSKSSVAFAGAYDRTDPMHSIYAFSNTDPVNLAKDGMPTQDIANVRMLTAGPTNGILLPSGAEVAISYNPSARTINLKGDYNVCNVYTAAGAKIASYTQGNILSISEAAEGVGIIELLTNDGKILKKIIF